METKAVILRFNEKIILRVRIFVSIWECKRSQANTRFAFYDFPRAVLPKIIKGFAEVSTEGHLKALHKKCMFTSPTFRQFPDTFCFLHKEITRNCSLTYDTCFVRNECAKRWSQVILSIWSPGSSMSCWLYLKYVFVSLKYTSLFLCISLHCIRKHSKQGQQFIHWGSDWQI